MGGGSGACGLWGPFLTLEVSTPGPSCAGFHPGLFCMSSSVLPSSPQKGVLSNLKSNQGTWSTHMTPKKPLQEAENGVNPFLETTGKAGSTSPGKAGSAWEFDARKGPSNHPILSQRESALSKYCSSTASAWQGLQGRRSLGQEFGNSIPWEQLTGKGDSRTALTHSGFTRTAAGIPAWEIKHFLINIS